MHAAGKKCIQTNIHIETMDVDRNIEVLESPLVIAFPNAISNGSAVAMSPSVSVLDVLLLGS